MSYLVVYASVLIHWIWFMEHCEVCVYTHNIYPPFYLVLVFHCYSYNHVCYTFPLLYSVPWQNQKIDPGGKKVNWNKMSPNMDNPSLHMSHQFKCTENCTTIGIMHTTRLSREATSGVTTVVLIIAFWKLFETYTPLSLCVASPLLLSLDS